MAVNNSVGILGAKKFVRCLYVCTTVLPGRKVCSTRERGFCGCDIKNLVVHMWKAILKIRLKRAPANTSWINLAAKTRCFVLPLVLAPFFPSNVSFCRVGVWHKTGNMRPETDHEQIFQMPRSLTEKKSLTMTWQSSRTARNSLSSPTSILWNRIYVFLSAPAYLCPRPQSFSIIVCASPTFPMPITSVRPSYWFFFACSNDLCYLT